jgi:cytochrome bd ubiquinol oxidase subunit II
MQPDLLLAIVLFLSFNLYILLGGADYGGGLWDLLSRGPRRKEQRELITRAITPVWEVNHVWLILVVVLLFTGFSPAFAAIAMALYVPLTGLLIGIVFRGVSFTLRFYETGSARVQRLWGLAFSIASLITPFLLGVVCGSILEGRVVIVNGASENGFLWTWLSLFPFIMGCLMVALCAYLAAAYLTVEATTPGLREDFRNRGLLAGSAVAILAILAVLSAGGQLKTPHSVLETGWIRLEHALSALVTIFALGALWRRKFLIARFAVAAGVSCVLWGWALTQYPFLIPPALTIHNSSAPAAVQEGLLLACLAGTLVLAPSMLCLYHVFKAAPRGLHSQDPGDV